MDYRHLPEGYYQTTKGDTLWVIQHDGGVSIRQINSDNSKSFRTDAARTPGTPVGRQKNGGFYTGSHTEELSEIYLRPADARIAFAQTVKRCGKCGKKISAEESIKRGFGPECAKNL